MTVKAKRSFGRELDAVIDIANISDSAEEALSGIQQSLKQVMVHQLSPGKFQPRKKFDSESLKELASSIKSQGILQPIIVRGSDPSFEIIAGERRWRAAQMAGLQQVPIIVCDISDESALAFGLIENIQRKGLNVIEEAEAIQKLLNDFSMTHQKVAVSIGRSRAAVSNILRLLQLSDSVKLLLIQGKLEMGHARALLPMSPEKQQIIADKIISQHLSVREAENVVKTSKQSKSAVSKKIKPFAVDVDAWVEKMGVKLSSKVVININEKGEGRVVINFTSPDEVDWLVEKISRE